MLKKLMILAAGRGNRMRHLTNERPKPLIPVLGQTLLDRVIDHARAAGISQIVVNTCYKGEMIEDSLKKHTDIKIQISREQEALETGGGVLNALPFLLPEGKNGFFVTNADPLWVDKTTSVFTQLDDAWDPNTTDILLAFITKKQAFGVDHTGDYAIQENLAIRKKHKEDVVPYFFTGIQIIHPRVFEGCEKGVFSLLKLYDKAEENKRLKAIIYDGDWYHVGTPESLTFTEDALSHD